MKTDTPERLYFPNLNGLRAIGASIVMIGHIEFLKLFWKVPAYQWFPVPGKIGVALFFALSGFLISSLLMNELKVTETISLKKFYYRRILRIWPLYYLVVILSIFIFNQIGFLEVPKYSENVLPNLTLTNILILVFLLPNLTHYYIPYADQRWSIIVEEQFYLLQPLVVKLLKKRKYLVIAFTIFTFSRELFLGALWLTGLEHRIPGGVVSGLSVQLKYLGCIAVGCLFSMFFFRRENLMKAILFTKAAQWLTVLVLCVAVAAGHYFLFTEEVLDYRVYTLLFAIIVINASQNPATIFKLETKLLNFLGSISYGIYMYHPVCIGLAIAIGLRFNDNPFVQNLIIYTVSIPLTILVSWLSFKYFESFFLKLKKKAHHPKVKLPEEVADKVV